MGIPLASVFDSKEVPLLTLVGTAGIQFIEVMFATPADPVTTMSDWNLKLFPVRSFGGQTVGIERYKAY
jgi:hypothetical protein